MVSTSPLGWSKANVSLSESTTPACSRRVKTIKNSKWVVFQGKGGSWHSVTGTVFRLLTASFMLLTALYLVVSKTDSSTIFFFIIFWNIEYDTDSESSSSTLFLYVAIWIYFTNSGLNKHKLLLLFFFFLRYIPSFSKPRILTQLSKHRT